MIKKIINFAIEKKVSCISYWKALKIKKNIRPGKPLDHALVKLYRTKWRKLAKSIKSIYLKNFSAISGMISESYVPEDVYYNRIEPVLNRKEFTLAYADKNFYERHFVDFKHCFPKTWLRGINGRLFDSEYRAVSSKTSILSILALDKECILKPASQSSGGRNVTLVTISSGCFLVDHMCMDAQDFCKYLKTQYRNNFVLQEKITQHPFFNVFNPSSVNTVRIFTYRSVRDETIHILQAVLRFGCLGSLVDNQASGGLSYGINDAGKLNSFAVDKWGRKFKPATAHEPMMNVPVPGFAEMRINALSVADLYFFHRLLGFDFCFTNGNDVKLLEVNCKNIETNFLQMNNGPLFGQLTDEIIEYCSQNKKSVVLDFEI